jgi:hypothetical protein
VATSDATNSLGGVFQQMGDYEGALQLHKMDLEVSESIGHVSLQARAWGNLGTAYESIRNYSDSVKCLEKQLSLTTDRLTKANACLSLGRVLHTMGKISQSVNYLRQGLGITQALNKSEEEAKIRYRLGISLRASNDNENARSQLETAAELLESVRYEQRSPEARTKLFDLQTSCYHVLQQLLVQLRRDEDALVMAERCRARIPSDATRSATNPRKSNIICSEYIFETVNRSKMNVIYYSIAGEELYAWFLQPQKRIVRFHVTKLDENLLQMNGNNTKPIDSTSTLLEQYINYVRDCLGVNSGAVLQEGDGSGWRSSSENLLEDFSNERAGFLRMVNRNHLLNSSNYSLSSLFSLGSVGGSVASLQGSTR